MMNDNHIDVMVDLETMGTITNASVVAVGAVRFDDNGLHEEFYMTATRESCKAIGMVETEATVNWWKSQSKEAFAEIENATHDIKDVLTDFRAWMKTLGPWRQRYVWGNSANFDNRLLQEAYRLIETPLPWHWSHDECYRTLCHRFPEVELEREGTHHNALDDAKTQATHAIELLRRLDTGKKLYNDSVTKFEDILND